MLETILILICLQRKLTEQLNSPPLSVEVGADVVCLVGDNVVIPVGTNVVCLVGVPVGTSVDCGSPTVVFMVGEIVGEDTLGESDGDIEGILDSDESDVLRKVGMLVGMAVGIGVVVAHSTMVCPGLC